LSHHDPLAVVRIGALAGVGLQNGLPGFLPLQEQRLVAIDIIRTMAHRVPTLPMPTTFIAASTM